MLEFLDPSTTPVVLSFIFVFAVVFGLMTTVNPLKFPRSVNAVTVVAFAAFAAAYEPFVIFLQEIMPFAAALLVAVFFLIFLKKAFEGKEGQKRDLTMHGIVMVLLLIVLAAVSSRLVPYLPAGIDATAVLWAIGIVIILFIFYIAYKKGLGPEGGAGH